MEKTFDLKNSGIRKKFFQKNFGIFQKRPLGIMQ